MMSSYHHHELINPVTSQSTPTTHSSQPLSTIRYPPVIVQMMTPSAVNEKTKIIRQSRRSRAHLGFSSAQKGQRVRAAHCAAELQLRSLNTKSRKRSLTTEICSASAFGSGYLIVKSYMEFWKGSRATNGEHAAAAAAGVSTRSKGGGKGKARLLGRRRWGIWTQLGLCSLLQRCLRVIFLSMKIENDLQRRVQQDSPHNRKQR